MNKLFIRLLQLRGLTPSFLNPKYEELADPFILQDMDQAVDRIKQAIKRQEKILIYGDYDVDGVTSSTLMEEALELAGIKPENIIIMLPDRFADGYGMSPKLIKKAKATGTTLVITVDCGSRNHAIIDELNHIEDEVSVYDVKKITFKMQNDYILQVYDVANISAVNTDKNFICINENGKSYFININHLIEVVVEYDYNS